MTTPSNIQALITLKICMEAMRADAEAVELTNLNPQNPNLGELWARVSGMKQAAMHALQKYFDESEMKITTLTGNDGVSVTTVEDLEGVTHGHVH